LIPFQINETLEPASALICVLLELGTSVIIILSAVASLVVRDLASQFLHSFTCEGYFSIVFTLMLER